MPITEANPVTATPNDILQNAIPEALLGELEDQTSIPRIAKDQVLMQQIRESIKSLPTHHSLHHCDARHIDFLQPKSVHLVVTSPPYWILKRYNEGDGQMGHIADYDEFLSDLERVWKTCYDALVPGGRLICVVGDVCLSRKQNKGRHCVIPLHSSIQEQCRKIGFDNLTPIIWHKIANAVYEAGGGGFLGKPYEPNGIIKNDIEFILMLRKPGGYRKPTTEQKLLSVISGEEHSEWFQQIWHGVTGASTKQHPAPYPIELANRLVRMYSFVGDVVLDPFSGTATTSVAASTAGRNSIGTDIDLDYLRMGTQRLLDHTSSLFMNAKVESDAQ
ncbi:MAG: DNA-methyltransferase [Phycisphaerales bacterium JB052]